MSMLKLKPFDPEELNKCKIIEGRFVCSICIEIFGNIELLKNHYVGKHGYVEKEKEQKSLPPPPPNILFESSYSTDEHNDDTEKDYFEESPPKEIPKKQSYFSPKICSICDMKFKNQKTLSKHVKHVHHKLKSLICQVCNKQFTRKSTLDIHTRTHLSHLSDESAKILSCDVCPFKCSDPSVINKHKKIHQTSTEGKYKCLDENCNYFAIQATGLKNHMLYKHPELYSTMKCTQCEFVSVNPERLKQHLLNHEKGLLDKEEETQKIVHMPKNSMNNSMEISSDCFLPIESTDSIHNHDQGGVTIIHNNSSSTNMHNEDAVF
ncbi:zinc finger protein 711 [Chironomus tepperi]|uniref:zinc finger protein 711 n=1 Tax=Chironomus tepperi TaxID=113505 RepID=UPI00391F2D03